MVVMSLVGTQETLQATGTTPGAVVSLESSSSRDRAVETTQFETSERANGDTGSWGQRETAEAGNGLFRN